MKKLLILIIVLLVGWNGYLTYRIENINTEMSQNNEPEIHIIENDVNGFSTDLTKVVDKVEPYTVTVLGAVGSLNVEISSGIVWKTVEQDVYILTVANNYFTSWQVVFDNGAQLDASLVGNDPLTGLTLLKTEPDFSVEEAVIGSSSLLKKGEWLLAVGGSSPLLSYGEVSVGVVSSSQHEISTELDDGEVWQDCVFYADIKSDQSNAGKALVNMNGELVGMISNQYRSGLLPADEITLIGECLLSLKEVNRCSLGISTLDIAELTSYQKSYLGLSLDVTSGLYIRQVDENSSAYKAGVRAGDILYGINEISITNMLQYRQQLYKLKKGDVITLSLMRSTTELKMEFSIE